MSVYKLMIKMENKKSMVKISYRRDKKWKAKK